MAGRTRLYQFCWKRQGSQEAWVQTTACSLISCWAWGVMWPFRFHFFLWKRLSPSPVAMNSNSNPALPQATQARSTHSLVFPLCMIQSYVVCHGQRIDSEDKNHRKLQELTHRALAKEGGIHRPFWSECNLGSAGVPVRATHQQTWFCAWLGD